MFVILVTTGKEKEATHLLEEKGFKILNPRMIKLHKKRGGELFEKEKTIFSGYIFLDKTYINSRDYHNIVDTLYVKKILTINFNLSETEEEYIRILNNDGKPIEKIQIYFDNNRAHLVTKEENSCINTKNIIRVNRRDRSITFKIEVKDILKEVTFNYEIA